MYFIRPFFAVNGIEQRHVAVPPGSCCMTLQRLLSYGCERTDVAMLSLWLVHSFGVHNIAVDSTIIYIYMFNAASLAGLIHSYY